uniref:Putative ovule protein n=1 Tax=Solanum chacoense TaxID=4108 RepID=A0A0V0H4D6_SOLCH
MTLKSTRFPQELNNPNLTQERKSISRTQFKIINFQLSRTNFAEIKMIVAWVNVLDAMKVSHISLGINPWRNDFDSARNLQERLDFLLFSLLSKP